MLDRTIAPKILSPVELNIQLPTVQQLTLKNNIPVYAFNGGAQEVCVVECVFYAGNWYEEKNIVAATTNFMLKNGTTSKNAFAINEHFEYYGAYLNRNCYNETATLTLHTLTEYLPQLLPEMVELLRDSVFPEEELEVYKKTQKQRLAVNLQKCDFVANRLIDEYLYGLQHPYGKYTSTLDYDALTREDLVNFYHQFYINGNCLIFVAGNLPKNLEELLNKTFGTLTVNKNSLPQKQHLVQPQAEKKHFIVNDENGVQGAIRMATPFVNRHHPDFVKAQILNTLFGGFFGSRLMSNIREDKGYTYGIHSYIQNHVQQTAWMISTEAGREVCKATIEETYKEMELLSKEVVDEEELSLVRNFMLGTILGDLDGPFQIINRWKNYILNGVDENYFYNSINTIKTITAEELQDLAKKYLQPNNFYELTVI
jgi:predicted Zn-dependent peptidase